jgi:hypothetical protein
MQVLDHELLVGDDLQHARERAGRCTVSTSSISGIFIA